jgi:hypothetical protein
MGVSVTEDGGTAAGGEAFTAVDTPYPNPKRAAAVTRAMKIDFTCFFFSMFFLLPFSFPNFGWFSLYFCS